jgi:Xaa-Pro aminopeptidase
MLTEPQTGRLAALRKAMAKEKLSALLILRPENRRYLSGYTAHDGQIDESSGLLLITLDAQYLLTDFRYRLQAEKEARGYSIQIYKNGAAAMVGSLMKGHRLRKLGFEEDLATVKFHRLLAEELPGVTLTAAPPLVENLRAVKDEAEIRAITRAVRVVEKALAITIKHLAPGKTEIELARILERAMQDLGAEGPAFESIVASGPNAALPHAVPGRRKIREGEPVVFDVGALVNGYRSDMTRTMVLGEPKPWLKKIYQVVRRAQLAALAVLRPGLRTDEADKAARDVIEKAGYGPCFGHGLGHGVGLATHEAPSLSWRMKVPLKAGMVVTVEPGIYLPKKGGVRLEEMVLITDDGCRVLNRDRHFYRWSAGRA